MDTATISDRPLALDAPGVDDFLPPIIHRTLILATPAAAFAAVATAEGLDQWFTQGTTLEPRAGGEIRMRWRETDASERVLEDGGTILHYEPHRRFVFTWRPASALTTVAIEMEPHGIGTLLTITETGYRRTEEDLRALINCATGWGEAATLLKWHLESI